MLKHGDRLLVGSHYYYIYVDPMIDPDEQVEFEFALKEANKDQMMMLEQDDSMNQKLKAMEEQVKRE